MIIELVGLPGVGKSFLSRSLERRFRDENIVDLHTTFRTEGGGFRRARSLSCKLARAVRFASLHPGTTVALLRTVHAMGDELRCDRIAKLINLLTELDRSARTPASRTLVSEQGVLQAIWSLEIRADTSMYRRLLRETSRWLPDAVVFVEIERRQYGERLRRRKGGRSRFDRLSARQLSAAIERGLREVQMILASWRVSVPSGERLDFWNDVDADAEAVVVWVTGMHRIRRSSGCPLGGSVGSGFTLGASTVDNQPPG